MEKNRILRDKMGFFRDFIGFHGKKWEITGFQGAKLDFTGKNEILREITGFCGREREIMGFYGKLCDFTVKCGILQENICYFTGDYRILRDIYIGFLREMTGFNGRLLQVPWEITFLREIEGFHGILRKIMRFSG